MAILLLRQIQALWQLYEYPHSQKRHYMQVANQYFGSVQRLYLNTHHHYDKLQTDEQSP